MGAYGRKRSNIVRGSATGDTGGGPPKGVSHHVDLSYRGGGGIMGWGYICRARKVILNFKIPEGGSVAPSKRVSPPVDL